MKKVGLREQLREKYGTQLKHLKLSKIEVEKQLGNDAQKIAQDPAWNLIVTQTKMIEEFLVDVAPFLEVSPSTEEMQKLLENLRKKIIDVFMFENYSTIKVNVLALLDGFEPKLEALLTNHDRTKTELKKLTEELEKDYDFYALEHDMVTADVIKKIWKRLVLLTKKGGE